MTTSAPILSVEKMLLDSVPLSPGLLTFRGTVVGTGVEIGFAFPPALNERLAGLVSAIFPASSNEAENVGAVAFAYLDAEGKQKGDALFVGWIYRDFSTSEFFFRVANPSGPREGGRSKSATGIAKKIFESATGLSLET